MKLRDHPGMNYRGIPNWPPVWTRAGRNDTKTAIGEIGVLVYVYGNERVSNKCYLVIDYDGETYVGTLLFSDQSLCGQILKILRQHIGKPISDIGELDVSQTM